MLDTQNTFDGDWPFEDATPVAAQAITAKADPVAQVIEAEASEAAPVRLGPGVYDLDSAAYHSDPCPEPSLSSTLAKILRRQSPRHAWQASARLNPNHESKDSAVFDIGRAAHRVVLGKGDDYVEIPAELLASNGATSTKAAKDFIAEARAAGKTPLKADVITQVLEIGAAVKTRLGEMGIILNPTHSEKVAIAEIDGIYCRCMIDNAPADPSQPLYDLKTTTDASLSAIEKVVAKLGYDLQDAHYRRVWLEATGEQRRFRFIFTEKEAPTEIAVVELYNDQTGRSANDYSPDEAFSGDWSADAEQALARIRMQWRACLDAGNWPGYPPQIALIAAPSWHRRDNLIRASLDPILPRLVA